MEDLFLHQIKKPIISTMKMDIKKKYKRMIVGTTENMIPFYVLNGFTKYHHTVKNFFVDNYDEEVWDGLKIMINNEHDFYNEIKNWDFSYINYIKENFTRWDMYEILRNNSNSESRVLDLGTGGGEKVLKYFPEVKEIIATDFSEEMIKTANENLKNSDKKNITFRQMDNLNMNTPDNYFDIVVARHTCIDAEQIYKALKTNGLLILRGVDKLDCWELKRLFGKGQAYKDSKPISLIDYENILDAGFKDVELVPIHIREYYKTKNDLLALLLKTPILADFSETQDNKNLEKEEIDLNKLDEYIKRNSSEKGILLIRRYYGITARK